MAKSVAVRRLIQEGQLYGKNSVCLGSWVFQGCRLSTSKRNFVHGDRERIRRTFGHFFCPETGFANDQLPSGAWEIDQVSRKGVSPTTPETRRRFHPPRP